MFTISRYRFELVATEHISMGESGGARIRGAVLRGLSYFCPHFLKKNLFDEDHWKNCPVCKLVGAHPNQQFGDTASRPIVIQYAGQPNILPGQIWTFDMTLIGQQKKALPYLIASVNEFSQGIGAPNNKTRQRGRSELLRVFEIHVNPKTEIYSSTKGLICPNREVQNLPLSRNLWGMDKNGNATRSVKIEFLTPASLVRNGRLMDRFQFDVFCHRLLDRIAAFNKIYGDGEFIPIKELLRTARQVKVVSTQTEMVDRYSFNTYERRKTPLNGLMGTVELIAPKRAWEKLSPYLLLGQYIGVGKKVTKGNGLYRVVVME